MIDFAVEAPNYTGTRMHSEPPSALNQADSILRVTNARLRWLESGLPYSLDFEDTYHSVAGAQAESRFIFLDGSDLAARLALQSKADAFVIGELGFGCGLNFLETWRLWQQSTDRPRRLHYIAFEKHPLRHSDLRRVLEQWPDLAPLSARLLANYPEYGAGCHRLHLDSGVVLDLHYGDALDSLRSMSEETRVHAWYLDGFSPALNPQLWDIDIAKAIASRSKPRASAVSYSVAGSARRALTEAGFSVEKRPGFGTKRHCLRARLNTQKRQSDIEHGQNELTLIVGAGLAGYMTALALLRQDRRVLLVDSASKIFQGASGIAQLALRPRLFRSASSAATFFAKAFAYARRQLTEGSHTNGWHPSGVIQGADAMNSKHAQRPEAFSAFEALYDERLLRSLSKAEAETVCGLPLAAGGLFFAEGGWLDTQRFGASLQSLASPTDEPDSLFQLRLGTQIAALRAPESSTSSLWTAITTDGIELHANNIVLCNSHALDALLPDSGVRLQSARGQISAVGSNAASRTLRSVVCAQRSLFPALEGQHTIAASYRSESTSLAPQAEDDSANLAGIEGMLAGDVGPTELAQRQHSPQVAIRSAGEDFLPVVGAAPAVADIVNDFAALRRNAQTDIQGEAKGIAGLYINVGHGSNGLATTPLCGEYIASRICAAPSPLTQAESTLIQPARFLLRDLKKQRV